MIGPEQAIADAVNLYAISRQGELDGIGEWVVEKIIKANAATVRRVLPSTPHAGNLLDIMGSDLEHDSRRWFPHLYADDAVVPLRFYFAVALAGEVGELCNFIKKANRDASKYADGELDESIGKELVDVLSYTLLLARACRVDLDAVLVAKRAELAERWEVG